MSLHDNLRAVINSAKYWTELRYHNRETRSLGVRKGIVNQMNSKIYSGVGIRVLMDGTWGFSSTSDISRAGLIAALKVAEEMALALSYKKNKRVLIPGTDNLARGDFFVPGFNKLKEMPLNEKFRVVFDSEAKIRNSSKQIEAGVCSYNEVFEDKIIITSDGADAHIKLAKPELRFFAFGSDGTKNTIGGETVGKTGAWECLFKNKNIDEFIETAASNAVTLLKAPDAMGGRKKVILAPSMVGLLSHEAIGHTVEADFIKSGSIAAGKFNQMVASPLITMCDSGVSEYDDNASGSIPVDDEGVLTEKTHIIKEGKLVSYLHNRETAHEFGVKPTGNARAWEFSDEPIIRMRNTYIEPGTSSLNDMIAGIDDGYFIEGAGGGQADATAEFMFGADRVQKIKNGKLGEFVQKLTVSGNAFDVLKSVDAVSRDFKWDMGAGYCGKGQPAKVDGGGPYIRCEINIGGAQ